LRTAALKVVFGFDDPTWVEAVLAQVPEADVVVAEGAGLRDALADADAVVCGRLQPRDTELAGRLRLIQAASAGADRIERAAVPAGCALCNLHGHEQAIAEWAVMAMLALSRGLLFFDRELREGRWHRFGDDAPLPLARTLRGRTVGAIGYGPIGRRTVELAQALGMETVSVTRTPREGSSGLDELPRLLERSDFAVVALPLNDDTRGLIGARELELLGPEGYLLNPARGPIVDEQALYEALRDGTIAGAAIDTWYRYPSARGEVVRPSDFPFSELPSVLMTPHVSGRSQETREARRRFVGEQIARLSAGSPLQNVIAVG
jgi:phosphoglycerate dehydrogenase-like enzyme